MGNADRLLSQFNPAAQPRVVDDGWEEAGRAKATRFVPSGLTFPPRHVAEENPLISIDRVLPQP